MKIASVKLWIGQGVLESAVVRARYDEYYISQPIKLFSTNNRNDLKDFEAPRITWSILIHEWTFMLSVLIPAGFYRQDSRKGNTSQEGSPGGMPTRPFSVWRIVVYVDAEYPLL